MFSQKSQKNKSDKPCEKEEICDVDRSSRIRKAFFEEYGYDVVNRVSQEDLERLEAIHEQTYEEEENSELPIGCYSSKR